MCRPNNKISKAAAQAFIERRPFRRDNTEVVVTSPSCAVLKLHGHVIGENSASRGMHLTMAGLGHHDHCGPAQCRHAGPGAG